MSQVTSDGDTESDDTNRLVSLVASVLIAIRSSFIAFVGAIGTVFLFLSIVLSNAVLSSVSFGIIAGMCLIWAVSAYVYAVAGYLGLRLIGYN